MSHGIPACVLCGSETARRVMALVEWTVPIGKEHWSNVPRCVDRAGCRATVELVLREAWPVSDGTPAPAGLVQAADRLLGPEPAQTEEVSPWLRG